MHNIHLKYTSDIFKINSYRIQKIRLWINQNYQLKIYVFYAKNVVNILSFMFSQINYFIQITMDTPKIYLICAISFNNFVNNFTSIFTRTNICQLNIVEQIIDSIMFINYSIPRRNINFISASIVNSFTKQVLYSIYVWWKTPKRIIGGPYMARMRTLRIPYFGSIIMEPHNRMFSVSRHEARSRRNGATAALHRITTHYFRMINWQRTRIRINGSDHARKMKCLPARIQAKYVISRCWLDVKKNKKRKANALMSRFWSKYEEFRINCACDYKRRGDQLPWMSLYGFG